MHCRGFTSVCAAILLASVVAADTSLYIPDTDPQPISAGVLGVGSDGRTTWLLQQGSATGTFTDTDDGEFFPGPATLVEGPSDAVVTLSAAAQGTDVPAVDVAFSCTISNSIAACVVVGSEGTLDSTTTLTETVSPILVQGGGGSVSSVAGSGPTSTTSGSSQTQTSSSGNQASAGSSPASSGAQPTESGKKNSAHRHQIAGGLMGLATAAASIFASVF